LSVVRVESPAVAPRRIRRGPFSVALGAAIGMLRGMHLVRSCLLGLSLAILAPVAGALADCTDPPGPAVNWRRCIFDRLDLQAVDLTGAELRDASFFRADLTGSTLENVKAFRAKFVNAMMTGGQLAGADLREADMTKVHLSGADLTAADLRRTRLFEANLRGADLTGAKLGGADLTRADLSGATWTDGKKVCGEGSIGRCN